MKKVECAMRHIRGDTQVRPYKTLTYAGWGMGFGEGGRDGVPRSLPLPSQPLSPG